MTATVIPIKKPPLADEISTQIAEVAAKATESERRKVASLIAEAEGSTYRTATHALTSAMAAILFLQHNGHNRKWDARWSLELSRRMKAGQWKRNNHTIGFYADGMLEDGGHRLAALAISNMTIELAVVFGVDKDAIDTVDAGRRRTGADHAGLDGIVDASTKQTLVKNAANYLVKAGEPSAALRSEVEVKQAIEENNVLLEEAIDIGERSVENINDPALNKKVAASLAYLYLKNGWASQRVRGALALFQQSAHVSPVGENDPFYVAGKVLMDSRQRRARGESLTTLKEMAVVVFAMVETEKGAKAVQGKTIKAALKGKHLPDPRYPAEATAQVA